MGVAVPVAYGAVPTCPTNPGSTGECDTGLDGCGSVCQYAPATDTWTCNLDPGFGATAGQGVLIANFQVLGTNFCSTGWDYAAWGTTRNNVQFFCAINSTSSDPIDFVELRGTANADELCFEEGNWILENADPTNVSLLDATMYGFASEDEMLGSPEDTVPADYTELLDAGTGGDDVYCQEGDDFAILGDGQDQADLGPGDDAASGGAGPDTINGREGDDIECGQGDDDTLNGNEDDDILDGGGQAGDTKTGGLHNGGDECNSAGTEIGCETVPIVSAFSCP